MRLRVRCVIQRDPSDEDALRCNAEGVFVNETLFPGHDGLQLELYRQWICSLRISFLRSWRAKKQIPHPDSQQGGELLLLQRATPRRRFVPLQETANRSSSVREPRECCYIRSAEIATRTPRVTESNTGEYRGPSWPSSRICSSDALLALMRNFTRMFWNPLRTLGSRSKNPRRSRSPSSVDSTFCTSIPRAAA